MKDNNSASAVAEEEKGNDEVVVEVGEGEETCRVCHLSRELGCSTKGSEMIRIGCECRAELELAHRDCGEAWFRVRGNRYCEICGMYAKNIIGQDDSSFMEEWHERKILDCSHDESSTHSVIFWRSRPFCNVLMGCLVIAFVLPWFFRVLF